ncbi:P-loop containing nucleoside triphosphate hydrolase protein [Rhizophagus irregularis DAOM 181602=DAOM 197198]|nr:P-loop containing nucleoside triphosphate hydrolase protein [Rhizophagus irregularis DAOM 181602=DAOM 197198]POG70305.1 P-loop containing nucleoside triphosphate hydrolase protein [Rhizophagus irregularis DAOM 181602=DAOM 197198]|eukprot:XP_025177171.1 P-loop containing nucleoside triphosphate hydrolase protein [Rhizophagus irregularis DAOM 181602=DAOM 197198]
MEQLRTQIDSLTQELERLKRQSSKIEEEIKSLQDKILEVGGDRLRAQKSKVDQIKEQIVITNERITKSQVAKSKAEKDITKFENSLSKNKKELEELDNEIKELTEEIQQNAEAAHSIRARADETKSILEDKKSELDEIKEKLDEKTEIINRIRAFELEIKNKLEDSERSLLEHKNTEDKWKNALCDLSLHNISDDEEQDEFQLYTDDELDAMSENTILGEINVLEERIKNANPNLSVLNEYRKREKEYMLRAKDLEEITTKCDECKNEYDSLRKQRLEEFMQGFTIISQKLKEMYQMITLGGNAELECCDSLDPFSEGIIFSVMPPKKSWKNISNLSGGEKTLSSLALVFALHHYKPTPLYVMDEIDAALDFRNVSIVANYIKERTKNAQFVVISLRNNMFELADRLIGIYKTYDKTKSITINPHEIEAQSFLES